MYFPNSGSGKPYCRIDGRSGTFALSTPEGGDPEIVEMKGRLLDLDLASATQGWLKISKDGPDWVALDTIDDWDGTARPSADHNPGVCVDLMCADWPAPQVRQLRGSSRAITGFIARVAEAAGKVPDGLAVRVRLTGANVKKFGMGSSAEIAFEMAPQDKWPDVATFDEHRDTPDPAARAATPAAAPTNGASGASQGFSDMKDSALDGPAEAAANAWE